MKRLTLALAVVALAAAGLPAAASSIPVSTIYGLVRNADGSLCSSGCQFVAADDFGYQPQIVGTGVTRTFTCPPTYWDWATNSERCGSFSYNAYIGLTYYDDGYSVYARKKCPTGGDYKLSATHHYLWNRNSFTNMGTFQILNSGGCYPQSADG